MRRRNTARGKFWNASLEKKENGKNGFLKLRNRNIENKVIIWSLIKLSLIKK